MGIPLGCVDVDTPMPALSCGPLSAPVAFLGEGELLVLKLYGMDEHISGPPWTAALTEIQACASGNAKPSETLRPRRAQTGDAEELCYRLTETAEPCSGPPQARFKTDEDHKKAGVQAHIMIPELRRRRQE